MPPKKFPFLETIRNQYMAEMYQRFRTIKGLIVHSIVDNDCFKIGKNRGLVVLASPLKAPFEFTENPEKVKAFMAWLRQAQDTEILEVAERLGREVVAHSEWQNIYCRRSYEKGIAFADRKMREAGIDISEEDIRSIFNRPIHADSLGMIYTRNFTELAGITEAMDQQISRELVDGLSQGKNPRVIARAINNRVDKIGITRARTLARTEVNRAQNEASLNRYRDYAVGKVELIVGPGPCPTGICADHAGVYKIGDAGGLLPLHPNCFDYKTEVLTDNGWALFKNVSRDDRIFSMNPETLEMAYLPYVHKVQYRYAGMMYHLTSNSFDLMATPDHQQLIGTRSDPHDRKRITWRMERLRKLAKRGVFYIPRYGVWKGVRPETIEVNGLVIDVITFVRFMAYYLSEGSTTRRSENSYQITISQILPQRDIIHEHIKDMPVKINESAHELYFNSTALWQYLYCFGKSDKKYVPDVIKEMSSELIKIFLEAYLLGDGSKRETAWEEKNLSAKVERQFFTSSERMASDLGELILKAGGYPGYSLQERKGKPVQHHNGVYSGNTDIWYVRWNRSKTSRHSNSVDYGLKIEEVLYSGMVYDVELAKWHVLLVRRNGKTAWSGNCTCAWAPVT